MKQRTFGFGVVGAIVFAIMVSGVAIADPVDRGDRLFRRHCKACHTVEAGDPHRQGPNLHGMFDRKAGTASGFTKYSTTIISMDFTWDDETLDRYLAEGRKFIPGTTMKMRPIIVEQQRHAIIAYLRGATR